MFTATPIQPASKPERYQELLRQARGLLQGECNLIANAANFSALVFNALPDVSWAGFYFPDPASGDLVVGPFQGQPACVRLPAGQGVCGAAVTTRQTQVVPDVAAFPGHIYCDGAARSEIVVPLFRPGGGLLAVWDVDSHSPARFDDADRVGMEALCAEFMRAQASTDPERLVAARWTAGLSRLPTAITVTTTTSSST